MTAIFRFNIAHPPLLPHPSSTPKANPPPISPQSATTPHPFPRIMQVAGTGGSTPAPATGLPLPLTRYADQDRKLAEQTQGKLYQHKDHNVGPPFRFDWKARPLTGLSSMKHSERNPIFQSPRKAAISIGSRYGNL
jgi:hypothetical protein